MDKVTEVLKVAKEILESEVEWCQGSYHLYDTETSEIIGACAVGAVNMAVETVLNIPAYDAISHFLRRDALHRLQTQVGVQGIEGFNDEPTTTKEDVLLMFKRAIVDGNQERE